MLKRVLRQYTKSYLYFTLSPTGASALVARNGRLRHFSRNECPAVPTTCTVGAEPMETEKSVTDLCESR